VHHALGCGADNRATNGTDGRANRTTCQTDNATRHRSRRGRAAHRCVRFTLGLDISSIDNLVARALRIRILPVHAKSSPWSNPACNARAGRQGASEWPTWEARLAALWRTWDA
jgi:hypothetical protein